MPELARISNHLSFDRPQLITPTGRLQDISARHLIDYLHRQSFTGTLQLQYREKRKKIWFFHGEVFRIQSNLVPELIGRMMTDRAWLNEADLRTCLKIQKELLERSGSNKRIGELVSEIHGVDEDEITALIEQQHISSFLQAMTWDQGSYEILQLDLKNAPDPLFKLRDIIYSLQSLFEVSPCRLGPLFEQIEVWSPDSHSVELSRMPLWSIIAGCRRLGLSGIISVRRQNKLYEIVLKYGIPLTLYEGTFGQPRQTIVVRQASEEHEKFFIEQLFKLFSFLTGTVHFRSLSDSRQASDEDNSYLQFRDETAVTKSVSSEELPFELEPDLLKPAGFFERFLRMFTNTWQSIQISLRRFLRL